MKYLFLTLVFVIVTSFTSGNHKQDSLQIPDSIHSLAMMKTDSQIDNLFSERITFKHLNDKFDILMRHMDSINAETIIIGNQRDSMATSRDEAILLAIRMQDKNRVLVKENTSLSKTKKWAEKGSHIVMIFFTVVGAIQFSKGVDSRIRKMKNENR